MVGHDATFQLTMSMPSAVLRAQKVKADFGLKPDCGGRAGAAAAAESGGKLCWRVRYEAAAARSHGAWQRERYKENVYCSHKERRVVF